MSCGRDTRRQHPSPVSGLPSPWPVVERDAAEVRVAQEVVQVVGEQLEHQAQVVPEHEVPLQVHCQEGGGNGPSKKLRLCEGQRPTVTERLLLQHRPNWSVLCVLGACVLSRFSRVPLFATLWIVAHQAPLSM